MKGSRRKVLKAGAAIAAAAGLPRFARAQAGFRAAPSRRLSAQC